MLPAEDFFLNTKEGTLTTAEEEREEPYVRKGGGDVM